MNESRGRRGCRLNLRQGMLAVAAVAVGLTPLAECVRSPRMERCFLAVFFYFAVMPLVLTALLFLRVTSPALSRWDLVLRFWLILLSVYIMIVFLIF